MKSKLFTSLALAFAVVSLTPAPASAQQHRATRLGNPATRFATPLRTPEDFRMMLLSEALRADVDFIERESGFTGDLQDFRRAAETAEINALQIAPGTRLKAMSTRKGGKPELLHDVLWAGKQPFEAYEFFFTSGGRRWRAISPKPCANFWLEDLGVEPKPALTLDCNAPGEVFLRQPAKVCLTLRNTGNAPEPAATVTLPTPAGAKLVSATIGARIADEGLVWDLPELAGGSARELCAVFTLAEPGSLAFAGTARDATTSTDSHCETQVKGIPGVLCEVVDVVDPIEVGSEETYEVSILNQGSATLTNLKMTCTLAESQEFVSGSGASDVTAEGRTVSMGVLPELKPKATVSWKVVVKAVAADDVRFTTQLTADQFPNPIVREESTQQY